MRSTLWTVVIVGSVLLTGCPGRGVEKKAAPCQKLGDQCDLEPGKLGACHYKADCNGPGCLYCQSQH